MPEYTLSLLFWIIPVFAIFTFLHLRRMLGQVQKKALYFNLIILSAIGFILDLIFARIFFIFPNPKMTLGINIEAIPVEEFIFYLFGFWFIILLYVFCDEYFLLKYNKDDRLYLNFARRIKGLIYFHKNRKFIAVSVFCLILFIALKQWFNPGRVFLPGYIMFLAVFAYFPYVFFWRITRSFLNKRALILVVIVTTLISIIWEVTLALPRGYWNYNHDYMIGIFIPVWSSLPIEAVTVWIFSSLIILSYEYTKIYLLRRTQQKRN